LTRLFAGSFFASYLAYGFRLMKSVCVANSMARIISKEYQLAREASWHWGKLMAK
jgi:hypothetical protein